MKILNIQTKGITSAAVILGFFSLISAFFGLFRDRLLAGRFGAGDELDIYYAAFRIPDLVSMVLIMGSISAAIIPLFSEYVVKNKDEAWRFLSNIFNIILFILILVCLILIIFSPQLISLITPGFSQEKKEMVVLLTRIMFLSPIILGTSNIISSVLQVFRRFFITSLSPILYNIGIIIGIVWFYPVLGLSGLAWGVVLGAFLHLLLQVSVLLKVGFKYKKVFDFSDSGFKKMLKLTIPRSIGLAAGQINFFIVTAIASTLTAGSLAVFSLSESLARPLLILTGISFSTAAFPHLTLSALSNKEKFFSIFSKTFKKILFLIIPLSFILFFFREEIISIILKVGAFKTADVNLTAACLAMFAIGLFAKALNTFIVKTFYSLQDTKTPAVISVLIMLLNLALCYFSVWALSFSNSFQEFVFSLFSLKDIPSSMVVGLPLALSVSSIIQFVVLYFIFQIKLRKFKNEKH